MNKIEAQVLYLIIIISWVLGITAAEGAWKVFFTVILPPYAWVVLAQKLTGW